MPIFNLGQSAYSIGLTGTIQELGNSQYHGGHMLGSILDYPNEAVGSAQEIQYTRIVLHAGDIIDRMVYFLAGNGSIARLVRMGIYSQPDPSSVTGVPTTRVAQTNITDTGGASPAFTLTTLTDAVTGGTGGTPTPYIVPITGFYWAAFVADNGIAKYAVTPTVRANFAPIRREATTSVTLPATVGTITNPSSAIVFSAAVQTAS